MAGWALRAEHQHLFPPGPSHLARYAGRFTAVEINSSFYREHRPATYARWAASVPLWFRFAVKAPKQITHEQRLRDADGLLDSFLPGPLSLGERLGPLLVQLPPRLELEESVAVGFLAALRERFAGSVVFEPRHPSWFTPAAEDLLRTFRVARVAADPAPATGADEPAGWDGIAYFRLHGSPRTYYSSYEPDRLARLAAAIHAHPATDRWCIFDNTALGAATPNALELKAGLER